MGGVRMFQDSLTFRLQMAEDQGAFIDKYQVRCQPIDSFLLAFFKGYFQWRLVGY